MTPDEIISLLDFGWLTDELTVGRRAVPSTDSDGDRGADSLSAEVGARLMQAGAILGNLTSIGLPAGNAHYGFYDLSYLLTKRVLMASIMTAMGKRTKVAQIRSVCRQPRPATPSTMTVMATLMKAYEVRAVAACPMPKKSAAMASTTTVMVALTKTGQTKVEVAALAQETAAEAVGMFATPLKMG